MGGEQQSPKDAAQLRRDWQLKQLTPAPECNAQPAVMSLLDQGIAMLLKEINKRCHNPITDFPVAERRDTCVALKFKKHYIVVHAQGDDNDPPVVYYRRQDEEEALSALEDIASHGNSHYGTDDIGEMVEGMFEDP
jgi:hypothetical protein